MSEESANFPRGVIVPWFNRDGSNPPHGWKVCDGTGGTPDLRDKFVMGTGDSANVGLQGGSATYATAGARTDDLHEGYGWFVTGNPSHTKIQPPFVKLMFIMHVGR